MSKSRILVGANSAALILSGMLLSVPLTGWAQIEEIVVSTRRKAENLQDVPIAVNNISADQIARQGISNVADVTKLATSVQFDQSFGPSDTRIAIRGLSNTRGRSNVAFLVDNVDTTTENFVSAGSGLLANQRLLVDVQNIEIVKGPQSALFGRAAFAGAISYTTKDPGEEFDGDLRLTAGSDGLYEVGGAIGGPVVGLEDKLGVRVSGAYWSDDGHYTNSVSGNNVGGEEGWGTAFTAVFTPIDEIKVKWRTEYSDSQFDQRANVRLGGGTDGRNLVFYPYPIDPTVIQGTSGTATRLADFGQYGPNSDPSNAFDPRYDTQTCSPEILAVNPACAGIWQPGGLGDANGLQPSLSEDAVTGQDYQGTDTQLLRSTLNVAMDMEYGTFSSITGFTDYDAFDELDQDYQARGRPDTLKAHQQGKSDLGTSQFSQEIRFASNFEGPAQVTGGFLYWKEERKQEDLNFIISCIESGKNPVTGEVFPNAPVAGICDGTNNTITSWQEQALQQFPCAYDANGIPIPDPATGTCVQGARTATPWRSDTEHKSVYLKLELDLSDTWTVEFENRTVWEDFSLLRPNFSSCSNLYFPFGLTAFVPSAVEGPVTDASQDIVCISEQRLNPNLPSPPPDANGNDWFLLQGAEKSAYNTPKVTAKWAAMDGMNIYGSWGIGQKPGGINTLAAGGATTTIDDERFESEKVQAWEVGFKSEWELLGFVRFNQALFFNDYTDKQIGTQIISPGGVLQPRIVNAAGAEVWGTEIEAIWQPSFAEGLSIRIDYTYLKAEFTEFMDDTRSMIRAAANGQCEVVDKAGTDFCRINLKGNRLERTPEHAFAGNIDYTHQLLDTGFDYFIELTGTYQGSRFLDADNAAKFDDYWLADARFGLTQDNWEFLLYVDNVFDNDTIQTGGSGPDFAKQVTQLGFTAGFGTSHFFGLLPDPRIVGAKLTVRF